ncbi:MAG: hypothetical protein U0326_03060 [Polyangiales bacterium]
MSKLAAQVESSQSKFAGYLKENKIDPARVVYASQQIEKFTPEDRSIKLAKRQSRGKEDDAAKAARTKKPRSGRPVTTQLVTRAIKGEALTGPQKTRILRAVGRVAEQKKLGEVVITNLF